MQPGLFDADAFRLHGPPLPVEPNPCIAVYGPGPEGARCKGCEHLYVVRYAGTYYKCDLRENTRGRATDHRTGWRACGRYVERVGGLRSFVGAH